MLDKFSCESECREGIFSDAVGAYAADQFGMAQEKSAADHDGQTWVAGGFAGGSDDFRQVIDFSVGAGRERDDIKPI